MKTTFRATGQNDSPLILSQELSTNDVERTSVIPVVVTSLNEIETNVIAQTEDIPQNATNVLSISNDSTNKSVIDKEGDSMIVGDKPEDIPSFSEWAQKRLEEAEKNQANSSKNVINGLLLIILI